MAISRANQPALRCAVALTLGVVVIAGAAVTRPAEQQPAATPTKEDFAKDNELFLTLARKALKWDEATRTHHFLEMLKPDIFLGAHAEWFGYAAKRDRAKTAGVQPWVNPEEYRQFVASQKREFEDQVDLELGVKK